MIGLKTPSNSELQTQNSLLQQLLLFLICHLEFNLSRTLILMWRAKLSCHIPVKLKCHAFVFYSMSLFSSLCEQAGLLAYARNDKRWRDILTFYPKHKNLRLNFSNVFRYKYFAGSIER